MKNFVAFMISFLSLASAYFLIVPPNAGPEEVNHAQASWYLIENPNAILKNQRTITTHFPSELTIKDAGGYLKNLACFSQKMEVPSNCQSLKKGDQVFQEVPMLNRSKFYYLLIGLGERTRALGNAFSAGKLSSFIISLVLIIIGVSRLWNKFGDKALVATFMSLTGTVYFFVTVINPSSLEFASTVYFVSSLLVTANTESGRGAKLHLICSTLLLLLSRSLGGLWIISFLVLLNLVRGKVPFFWQLSVVSFFGTLAQFILGNTNYPLGDGTWNPPWNFYLEEAVRVFNGSGDWIVSYFGTIAWSEVRLPLILVLVLLISYIYVYLQSTTHLENQRYILLFIFAGAWLVPLIIAVTFSKDWPGFWQGRYSLPFVMGATLILICNSKHVGSLTPVVLLFLSNLYLVLLTFARFNWGLYGTNTPIIANGWSFSYSLSLSFAVLISIYVISSTFLLQRWRLKVFESKHNENP